MKELWSWIRSILVALLIIILARQFLIGNYIVKGESMMPNLKNGDRLIVNKMAYRVGAPHRFDIIVFHATASEDYVKRIIGLPGDTVSYRDDRLYVNGKPVKETYLNAYKKRLSAREKLTENFSIKGKTGKMRVPKHMLWVMGDNRRNSEDSRFFGFVNENQVVGKVDLRYWPAGNWRLAGLSPAPLAANLLFSQAVACRH